MTCPLVPGDADLRDFQFMPLDVVRLIDSDLIAIASGDEFKAAVILWCKSWHQVPAASLPNDDRMLAHLAGYGRDIKGWRKVREMALKGFVLCDDGRLYHPVVAEKALEAVEAKRVQRERTAAATAARAARRQQRDDANLNQRDEQHDVPRDEQRDVDRNVVQGTGTGTVREDGVGLAQAREPLADLEVRLREAAGWEREPAPKLAVTGEVQALIDSGADLDLDVLPIVRALAPQCGSRTSWRFFIAAIARQRDQRIAAATIVSPPTAINGNHHAAHRQKPSRTAIFDAIHASIDRAEHGAIADGGGDLGSPVESAA